MDDTKNGNKRFMKIAKFIVFMLFAIQIIFLFYMNFFHMKDMVDYDSSCVFAHCMEIWKQRTLFIKEWGYQTSLDLDSTVGFVALLYGITHNIFISQAIGNCLIICGYIYVMYRIFSCLKLNGIVKLLGLWVFFIPYTLGQLGYAPMLFTASAPYAVRVLLPLTLISIILEVENGVAIKRYIVRYLLLCCFTFFAGLSSGVYVLLCGIAPMILFECVNGLIRDNFKSIFNKRFWMCCVVAFCACMGIVLARLLGYSSRAESMVLVDNTTWLGNIGGYLVGIYDLFGGVASQSGVPLMSRRGIIVLVKWGITTYTLIALIYRIVYSIRNKKVSIVDGFCFSIFAVNALALTLMFTTYGGGTFESRYHLMPMLPLFILATEMSEDLVNGVARLFGNCVLVMYGMMIFIASFSGDVTYRKSVGSSIAKEMEVLNDSLENENVDTVIVIGNILLGRNLRVYTDDLDYITTTNAWDIASSWGESRKKFDVATHAGTTAVVISPEELENLPQYVKEGMRYYDQFYGMDIYLTTDSKFDYVGGLPEVQDVAIDFPYTRGYSYQNAEINEAGNLVSNGAGGIVLWGPYTQGVEGTWNYTIKYTIRQEPSEGDALAYFSVTSSNGEKDLGSVVLETVSNEAVLSNVQVAEEETRMENRVVIPDGMIIEIESIKMEKVGE